MTLILAILHPPNGVNHKVNPSLNPNPPRQLLVHPPIPISLPPTPTTHPQQAPPIIPPIAPTIVPTRNLPTPQPQIPTPAKPTRHAPHSHSRQPTKFPSSFNQVTLYYSVPLMENVKKIQLLINSLGLPVSVSTLLFLEPALQLMVAINSLFTPLTTVPSSLVWLTFVT